MQSATPLVTPTAIALTRAKVLKARNSVSHLAPGGVRAACEEYLALLEEPLRYDLTGPAFASVAASDTQRKVYVEIARAAQALAAEIDDLAIKFTPLVAASAPDLLQRLVDAHAARLDEPRTFASIVLCLMETPDDSVRSEDALVADRLRFEAAKGVVETLHDDAFRRLAR